MPKNENRFDYVNEIWNIADYVRDIIPRKEYNKVILPFALLRRLECALEPTRDAVCRALEEHEAEWGREHDNYCQSSGKAFYNVTNFRLDNLGSTDTLDALMAYIDGFSPNAREILYKFKMRNTCETLEEHNMLYEVCRRFSQFDLSPENVSDREMSNIYEHLIERFGEEIAEDAEDFMTPRDVVRLAVGMIFANDDELMNSDKGIVRTIYDPTMGTGGFITDALDLLDEWHKDKKMVAPALMVPYGQECEAESWAMGKANLLLRNIDNEDQDIYDQLKDLSAHVEYGDTLSDDKHEGSHFNYILSNPPYGKKWEKEKDAVLSEAALGFAGRFGAGLPSIDDGSMLFLQHVVSKMAPIEEGGGKVGIVLSASPLFTGDAGSGPSNIRRWLFKEDLIDCIVKLPAEIFFRTGISTYLWILSNKKSDERKGKIQLIDASEMKTSLHKTQGKKRYEISKDQMDWIIKTYIDGHDHGNSVMVSPEEFMYRKVTTQRPLRMKIKVNHDKFDEFFDNTTISKLSDVNKEFLKNKLSEITEVKDYYWADEFAKDVKAEMEKTKVTPANISKAIRDVFGIKDKSFDIVKDKYDKPLADPELKDSENIPLGKDFKEYMTEEVWPFAKDAWIDETVLDKGPLDDHEVGIVGTNITFNKYFYKYIVPREPKEIANEIKELEAGFNSFMEDFVNE